MSVAAAAAAAATADAPLGSSPGGPLRLSSGDGEEVPLSAARGGGARTELPEGGLAVGAEEVEGLAFRIVREGEPVGGGRRFSEGDVVLRSIEVGGDFGFRGCGGGVARLAVALAGSLCKAELIGAKT